VKRLLPLILLLSCTPKTSQDLQSRLNMYFKQKLPDHEPGGAVLIMKDTTVIFSKGYGLADLTGKEKITTKTLFNIGSISKTFVSNAILILRDEGKLSLEDSLLKYFPGFKNKGIAQKVKIKHLLTHTSGLPDNRQVKRDSVFYLTANDEQNWYPVTQTDTLEFEPGSHYHYSNPAFNALALIITQVSGQKWQDFVANRIFRPSKMNTSTITDGPHPQSGVAHAYSRISGQWREDDFGEEPTFCAAGNGGVWSSAEELSRYELALRRGNFLALSTIDESASIKEFPNWSSPDHTSRGWAWKIDHTADGLKIIGHTGDQGGFVANYVSIPEKKIFVVILCNFPLDLGPVTDHVMALLQGENYLER
jgi:CubicO group peptidase (beta-lactamase class C family)